MGKTLNPSSRKIHRYRVVVDVLDFQEDFEATIIMDAIDLSDIVKQIKEMKKRSKLDKLSIKSVEEIPLE